MRFEIYPLGFKIIPETASDGYRLAVLAGKMEGDASIQQDPSNPHVMMVNTEQLARVDEVVPWQGTGLGRIGYIQKYVSDASPE